MATPYANPIEEYDPVRHAIRLAGPFGDPRANYRPVPHGRYFLENLPRFLDVPGEYYFAEQGPLAGRLYVRLPREQDPNGVAIEIAERPTIVDIREQSHIHISGLTFRFQNVITLLRPHRGRVPEIDPACVKALGACQDIHVANCKFEHIVRALLVASGGQGIADEIAFTDNDIQHTDYGPILVHNRGGNPPAGNLYRLEILRNRLYEVGVRPLPYDHGHAVQVIYALSAGDRGNILDRCWGAGLYVWGGKGSAGLDWEGNRQAALTRPLSRVLMHHNKVTNFLLNSNDWGGIEFWQNGPAYIYDNISGNPGGYWHANDVGGGKTAKERTHASARFGFAYYLDGGIKTYVFNNVAWGKTSDLTSPLCATTAFHEVIGFMNAFFNNTAYRFAAPFRRQASFGGHSAYLGNLMMDSSEVIFRHADITAPEDTNLVRAGVRHYPTESMAYANNVFVGRPRVFGYFDLNKSHATLEDFRAGLAKDGSLASQTGWQAEEPPVLNAEKHDFRAARRLGRHRPRREVLRPLVVERRGRRMAVLQAACRSDAHPGRELVSDRGVHAARHVLPHSAQRPEGPQRDRRRLRERHAGGLDRRRPLAQRPRPFCALPDAQLHRGRPQPVAQPRHGHQRLPDRGGLPHPTRPHGWLAGLQVRLYRLCAGDRQRRPRTHAHWPAAANTRAHPWSPSTMANGTTSSRKSTALRRKAFASTSTANQPAASCPDPG